MRFAGAGLRGHPPLALGRDQHEVVRWTSNYRRNEQRIDRRPRSGRPLRFYESPRTLVYVTEPALSGTPAARLRSAHAALAEATFGVARGRTDPLR
jgi:hypothetical protein